MNNLIVECTVHFSVKKHNNPDALAKAIAGWVQEKLFSPNNNLSAGIPTATRVFDENGNYVTEF